jgi:hypothetical protein
MILRTSAVLVTLCGRKHFPHRRIRILPNSFDSAVSFVRSRKPKTRSTPSKWLLLPKETKTAQQSTCEKREQMLNLLLGSAPIACAAAMLAGVAFAQPSTLANDGQWTMPAKNFESTRCSRFDQIKIDNAKDLRVAWTFSTGVNKDQEAAPST